MLNVDLIERCLFTKSLGRKLLVFKSTASTNDIAREYAANSANEGLVIFSESQRSGRGRRGNAWFGGEGESLLFSVVIGDCMVSREILTLLFAVAVAEVLRNIGLSHVQVKWPNDVLVDGLKIAGVLIEAKGGKVVAGVGLNCHQGNEDFCREIAGTATSIDIETGKRCERNVVAGEILNSLEKWIDIAEKDKQQVVDRWQNFSSLLGTRVGLLYNNNVYYGNCIGLDPENGLILQIEGGGVRMFEAAFSSVVKD